MRKACLGQPGDWRVVRGGSWHNNANNARAAYRNDNHPDNRNDNNGFRVVARRPTSLIVLLLQGFRTLRLNWPAAGSGTRSLP
jgi:hypothetical protein